MATSDISEKAAQGFASCLEPSNVQSETWLEAISQDTDQLLARIDAYNGLLTTLSVEREELQTDILPHLKANCKLLVELFKKIDQIESVVCLVKDRMQIVEDELDEVDKPSTSVVSGMLRSIKTGLFKRSKSNPAVQQTRPSRSSSSEKWISPELWNTKELFPPVPNSDHESKAS
eukprot:gene5977-7334_t